MRSRRRQWWEILEGGSGASGESRAGRLLNVLLVALILANAIAVALESIPDIGQLHADWFAAFDTASVAVFSLEYAARLWAAASDPRHDRLPSWRARLAWARSPLAIADLLAVAPFYLALWVGLDLRLLRLLRVLRILKLTRYSPALATVAAVVCKERRSVVGSLMVLGVLLMLSAATIHAVEGEVQPDAFGSIPASMWWAIATLSTVGYGDVTPITAAGRVVGGLVMMLGIGVFSLWTSIFATGYIEEIKRRDFVVTWHMVARVPIFAALDAGRIAAIAALLKPELVPSRFAIVRRGEPADAMYFIITGEAEVELPQAPVRLRSGQFFGELALLEHGVRHATVTAMTECQLLRLGADDFEALLRDEPALREAITATAEQRLGRHG